MHSTMHMSSNIYEIFFLIKRFQYNLCMSQRVYKCTKVYTFSGSKTSRKTRFSVISKENVFLKFLSEKLFGLYFVYFKGNLFRGKEGWCELIELKWDIKNWFKKRPTYNHLWPIKTVVWFKSRHLKNIMIKTNKPGRKIFIFQIKPIQTLCYFVIFFHLWVLYRLGCRPA